MLSIRERVNFLHYKKCYLEIKKTLLGRINENPEKVKEMIASLDGTYYSIEKDLGN